MQSRHSTRPDADLDTLAASGASVVYCPRSRDYFGHEQDSGPHRYREMLQRGINVALGTDSILNIPEAQSDRLSTLDEMRLLHTRDRTDPLEALRMATTNGARALGMNESVVTFSGDPHEVAGIGAVDAPSFQDALAGHAPARLLAGGGVLDQTT